MKLGANLVGNSSGAQIPQNIFWGMQGCGLAAGFDLESTRRPRRVMGSSLGSPCVSRKWGKKGKKVQFLSGCVCTLPKWACWVFEFSRPNSLGINFTKV